MNSGVKQTLTKNSAWCRRTVMERYLILATMVIFLIALAVVISLSVILYRIHEHSDIDVCSNPGCIHTASSILKYMDDSADPCNDFYQFACGGFLKMTNIPEDKSRITAFTKVGDTVRDQLKLIVEEPLPPGATKPYKLIKKIYNICMNTSAIEAEGLNTVKAIVNQLGGWPLLEGNNWNERQFEWKQLLYKLRKLGFGTSYFLSLYVGIDDKNSTRRVLNIDQPGLGLSREFLIKGRSEKLVKAYYEYMVDIAVLFGANRNSALKELNATLDFEINLANISLPKEKRRNATALYNLMTVRELQEDYPNIPWMTYINNILVIPGITINEEETIIVAVPKYLSDLDELLRKTPKRVQANYIMRRVVLSTISYLPEKLRNRQLEYYKTLNGQSERESRWKECTRLAAGSIRYASGAAYVRKFFKHNAKKQAEEMVADIRAEFVKMLKKVDWMDNTTRKSALNKAASMMTFIAYPDELLDDRKIEKFYANVEVTTDNYLRAMKSLSLFYRDYYNKKLREPVNKTEWTDRSSPTIVNAFYSSLENSIEFPAGILQGVFFDADRPRYMNYGGIGYVIGHEITHGFDDQGRQFDQDGNLNEWWEEDTKTAFIKKAQCIIDQYGNYTVAEVEMNLNGINTQGENIADNGGIKEAYLAYQSWVERNGKEKHLPGLNYTPNQLFWISAANTWCAKQRKESLKLQVSTGYHSPGEFRILGPFSNTEYFAKDFNCPLGSKMNPVKKCKVW